MSQADEVVAEIEKDYPAAGWDGPGFQGDQAKNALDKLLALNSTDFKEAFDKLERQVGYQDLRETLAEDAGDLKNVDKYKDIINALKTGDPTAVVNAKKNQEDADKTPKFDDGYGWELRDEAKHLHWVDLYQPKGASESLIRLIDDTEFIMQWGFDTLGARNPKAAPDFSNVLDSEQVTTAGGWSQIVNDHEKLKNQLDKRQKEYTDADKDIKINIGDAKILNSETYKNLKGIVKDLNDKLQVEFTGRLDGDKITVTFGGASESEKETGHTETIYKKGKNDKFYLTPEAEQKYYVKALDDAADSWEKEYENAVKKFQDKARDVDDSDGGGDRGGDGGGDRGGGGDGGGYTGSPFVGQNLPEQNTAQNEDFSSEYDDLLSGTTDDSSTVPVSDTSVGGNLSSALQAVLRNGTGTGTGTGTPAVNSGASDAMQMMMMMNALSQMGEQANRQPGDDKGNDERDSRAGRQRERNSTAPTATAKPAVQTTPPEVTAPTYASTPPVVTTPGGMVNYQIGKSTVQVSSTVAEALQRQQQNIAIDAAAAYAGTTGESTPNHPWATINEVAQLKTGDVVQWQNHSALIVNTENGLQILDKGQFVPLDPNSPSLIEKYGNFRGFFHPTGLDVSANADRGSTAPPPPTASQAKPAGPPPVSPPMPA